MYALLLSPSVEEKESNTRIRLFVYLCCARTLVYHSSIQPVSVILFPLLVHRLLPVLD
jgi:hypothetical protein